MVEQLEQSLDTSQIKSWRSIITLIIFVITSKCQQIQNKLISNGCCHADIIVLFPFSVPIFVPRPLWNGIIYILTTFRIIPSRKTTNSDQDGKPKFWVRTEFPMNFLTAPLIADLFLLAISAIGRSEIRSGTQVGCMSNLQVFAKLLFAFQAPWGPIISPH